MGCHSRTVQSETKGGARQTTTRPGNTPGKARHATWSALTHLSRTNLKANFAAVVDGLLTHSVFCYHKSVFVLFLSPPRTVLGHRTHACDTASGHIRLGSVRTAWFLLTSVLLLGSYAFSRIHDALMRSSPEISKLLGRWKSCFGHSGRVSPRAVSACISPNPRHNDALDVPSQHRHVLHGSQSCSDGYVVFLPCEGMAC